MTDRRPPRRARFPGTFEERAAGKYDWRFPGGESYADAAVRARRALQTIADAGATTPVVVTHEMLGRVLLQALLNLPVEQTLTQSLPHGTILYVHVGARTLHRIEPGAGDCQGCERVPIESDSREVPLREAR